MLYLLKHNLRVYSENHLQGLTYTTCYEDIAATKKSMTKKAAFATIQKDRPTTRSRSTSGKQLDLHGWFDSRFIWNLRTRVDFESCIIAESILSLL